MSKWFEEIDSKNSNVIYSRVRLARNWDEYVFPSRMTAAQCGEMVERLREGLKGLKDQDGRDLSYSQLDQMQELEKMALRERRILNMACVSRKEPSGLLLSADESGSIVLGGDDHIRMQILSPGLKLDELWQKADVLDDYVNERFSYAFDERRVSHFLPHQCGNRTAGPVWCFICQPYPRCASSRALWRI